MDFDVFDSDSLYNMAFEESEEEIEEESEEEIEEESIDYSSILSEMNQRLENIENNTSVDYTNAFNGILTNICFLDFVGFTLFIFLMLFVVIKFFKIFF